MRTDIADQLPVYAIRPFLPFRRLPPRRRINPPVIPKKKARNRRNFTTAFQDMKNRTCFARRGNFSGLKRIPYPLANRKNARINASTPAAPAPTCSGGRSVERSQADRYTWRRANPANKTVRMADQKCHGSGVVSKRIRSYTNQTRRTGTKPKMNNTDLPGRTACANSFEKRG
jgi:hypothetical protein